MKKEEWKNKKGNFWHAESSSKDGTFGPIFGSIFTSCITVKLTSLLTLNMKHSSAFYSSEEIF